MHCGLRVATAALAVRGAAAGSDQWGCRDRVFEERGEPCAALRAASADYGVQPGPGDAAVTVAMVTAPVCKSGFILFFLYLFVCLFSEKQNSHPVAILYTCRAKILYICTRPM